MRSADLKRYLLHSRATIHAHLLSASKEADAESIDLEVDVDLPQRPLYRINKTEKLRVRFPLNDGMPEVFALRKNFPYVPHLGLNGDKYPRQLCLYERSWVDERENWTPRGFIERIRQWLSGTANGTLHRADQPLEPIMMNSPARIALPEIPLVSGKLCRIDYLFLVRRAPMFWFGQRQKPVDTPKALPTPVLFILGPTSTHGIIREFPQTLEQMEILLAGFGGSLIEAISAELVGIREELKKHASSHLLLVLQLPKSREEGGAIETVEHRAFFVGKEISELFKTEQVQAKQGLIWVPEERELFADPERLKATKLLPLSVRWHLSSHTAALMNGHNRSNTIKIVAIGAGAVGSQTMNNLWRGGFGEWTIVDDDDVETHNPARHLLGSDAVGYKKAYGVSLSMQSVFPESVAPSWIGCNYLCAGDDEPKLTAAIAAASLIVDFSASVTVGRTLAHDKRSAARRIAGFLNQRGDESILLVEDVARINDLFWLEAEYLRAVAFDSNLRGHFDDISLVAHRYGNGCRDVSVVVPQDGVALHSALLSHHIRRMTSSAGAAVVISRWLRATGAVTTVSIPVAPPLAVEIAGWRILLNREVVRQLVDERSKNLPVETGGILLGVVDRNHQSLAIVGMRSAPSDSEAWPTSFIRGSNGLGSAVGSIAKRTLGNVVYVGEWHSHPNGCDAHASVLDLKAVEICAPDTRADGLPTLMLIIAADAIGVVLKPVDEDKVLQGVVNL